MLYLMSCRNCRKSQCFTRTQSPEISGYKALLCLSSFCFITCAHVVAEYVQSVVAHITNIIKISLKVIKSSINTDS